MKTKKLGVMRIKDDVPNPYIVLGRDEMKSILAGSSCVCEHNDCTVVLDTVYEGWAMSVCCDGLGCEDYGGSGQYGGAACGGSCP